MIDTNNISSSAGSNRSRGTVPVNSNTTTPTPVAAEAEAPAARGKDSVVLSQGAQNLTRLQTKIASLPDVNMSRVMAIKQAIAEGRFEINADRIAENMLNQDELLG